MQNDSLFHTILATDVEKSGGRNDNLLLRARKDLWQILTDTLARQRIDIATLATMDDGDGFRLLVPADIAPSVLLEPFLGRLDIELRQHREAANAKNRLRLRVAMHSGLLFRDLSGAYAGSVLKDCARLLDAPVGRELLAEDPSANMVVLLTDAFYRDVVAGGTTLDPALFQRILVRVKEADVSGWAHVWGRVGPRAEPSPSTEPSHPTKPPASTEPPAPAEPVPSRAATRNSTVNISGVTDIGTVIGGDNYGRL